jgi:hypothetical protein
MEATNTKTTPKTAVDLTKVLAEFRTFVKESGAAARSAGSAARHLILAAILGGADGFEKAVNTVYEEIRTNKDGMAKAANAEKSEDGKSYVIPPTIRTQVAQVQRALRFKVRLGSVASPITPTDMRKKTVEKAEAAKKAAPAKVLTGDDAIRASIVNALSDFSDKVKSAEGERLARLQRMTADFCVRALTILTEKPQAATQPQATPAEIMQPTPAAASAIVQAATEANAATAANAARQPRVTVRRKRATEARAS